MSVTTTSKNLGLVAAIHVGATEPSNHYVMWIDNSAVPYKRKFWDTVTQQWLEVIFVATDGGNNPNKRLNVRVGGTTTLSLADDVYVMNVAGGGETINILPPSLLYAGVVVEIVNFSGQDLTLNHQVYINMTDKSDKVRQYSSVRMVVAEYYEEGVSYPGQNFEWLIISNSNL